MAEKTKTRFGIFPKMLIAIPLIAVVPLAVTWYINLKMTSDRIYQHVNQQLDRVAEGLVSYVDTWVEMNLRMLRQNVALPQIWSMDPNQQNKLLKKLRTFTTGITLPSPWTRKDKTLAAVTEKKTRYYGDRKYVQTVLRGAPRGQQVLIGKNLGQTGIRFVSTDPASGQAPPGRIGYRHDYCRHFRTGHSGADWKNRLRLFG